MKNILIAIVLALCSLFVFSPSVNAAPRGVNQKAVAKAVQKELARERAVKAIAARKAANRARNLRLIREIELRDFNRRLFLNNALFLNPFANRALVLNPFLSNRFFFANRNFAFGF